MPMDGNHHELQHVQQKRRLIRVTDDAATTTHLLLLIQEEWPGWSCSLVKIKNLFE